MEEGVGKGIEERREGKGKGKGKNKCTVFLVHSCMRTSKRFVQNCKSSCIYS